jgi:sugar lactone lactonase YvrE
MTGVAVLAEIQNTIGESPVWLDEPRVLAWVDAERHEVFRRAASDGRIDRRALPVPVTAIIPHRRGGWVVVTQDGLFRSDDEFEDLIPIVDPAAHDPRTRLNDGVADPVGRVWTGSMSRGTVEEPIGRLYVVDVDGTVREVDDGFAVANGIALSSDGALLYASDMFHARIRVYRVDPASGAILERLPPISTQGPGHPDGLAVDRHGMLWVAYWEGSRVEHLDPQGQVMASIELPVTQVTRPCLGGQDGRQLYVTTARYELDEAELARQPLAGAVFSMDDVTDSLPVAMAGL